MRTDVKIGIAVALLFVIAVVSYYAIFGGGDQADPNGQGTEVAGLHGGEGARVGDGNTGPGSPALPRFGGLPPDPITPPPSEPEAPNAPAPEPPGTPGISITPIRPEAPGTPASPGTSEPPGSPTIREEVITPSLEPPSELGPTIREESITPAIDTGVPSILPRLGPGPGPVPTPAGPERTYVVQEGDAGFWAIAEKVYGDGRHWAVIAKANPDADSNALRPGRKLRIPPKPAEASRAAAGPAGGLVIGPTGQRHYIVKKGDAGFWGIAQAVYGDGKHWALIAKANPNVNSIALKPGDRLAIPPQPSAATVRPAEPVPTVDPATGDRLYVVAKSDTAGFWGIARKAYGSGVYWPVIAKANANVNSSSLKVGQKLVLPKLTEEMRLAAQRPTTPTRRTPRVTPDDVEDIGRQPVFRR
jgi:nucleoid-associated protein YgaU